MTARSQRVKMALAILALLAVGIGVRPSLADEARAPVDLRAELTQLAEDFNLMYRRNPIVLDLNGVRCTQKQTFLGLYEKNAEGDYVQKNLCDTTADSSGGGFQLGNFDGEQRLTVEKGRLTIYATYTLKGGQPKTGPPAAIERLGNGIVFRAFQNPEQKNFRGTWQSNNFYITRDGRHGSVRSFTLEPQNDDHFIEVAAPGK